MPFPRQCSYNSRANGLGGLIISNKTFHGDHYLQCQETLLHFAYHDTLPSPSNLKRWKLTNEASCFLCNKDTCTTSHILGACKIALSQGRFTFRHDNVLRIVISNIRSSVKNIKSSVPTSKQPIKIKFVKTGTRLKNKNSSRSGTLHQASDWVLLGDLDGTFFFPPHIAFTELRPDITIFSNKLKRVILIELTCPCE